LEFTGILAFEPFFGSKGLKNNIFGFNLSVDFNLSGVREFQKFSPKLQFGGSPSVVVVATITSNTMEVTRY
jgi:hypothetical protein